MQLWEYKTVFRTRDFDFAGEKKNADWMRAKSWNIDIDKELEQLGSDGWELVAVVPRSGLLGATPPSGWSRDYAGFTNEDLWVFKRPKP